MDELQRQIEERLAAAEERRQLHRGHIEQRMAEIEERYRRFNAIAADLVRDIVRPRMEALAGHFDNAELEPSRPDAHHGTCRFRRTDRFPATTTLRLGIARDERFENVLATYSLEILPIFIRFDGKDQIDFPLDGVDHERLAAWVDEKILQFVETYLRLEQAEPYQRENQVTDPVCGMRIAKHTAAAREEHEGRTFYFCVEQCREKFLEEPSRYASSAGT